MSLVSGPLVELDGEPLPAPASRRAWALLAWLALNGGDQPRARVAAEFWPDVLDESARASLRSAVWALRRALGPAADAHLTAGRDALALRDARVDLREAERLAAAGDLATAVALADGELLPGIEDDWAVRARDEHRERVIGWLEALAADAPADEAIRLTRRQAALDPLGEEAHRRLMKRLGAGGDRAGALGVYGRLCERLRRELAVAPSAATRDLAAALRAEPEPESEPDSSGALSPPARMPPLVGRERELGELLAAWESARRGLGGAFTVVAAPGIGKTRLVQELMMRAGRGGARTAVGVALDVGGGAPFAIWAELLRDLLRDAPEPPPDAPWPDDLAPLLPELARSAGARRAAAPDVERARLLEAVASLVEWAADSAPLALVIEDAHGADPDSLELAAYVGRRLARLPVLLVITRRELPRRPELDAVEQELRARGALAGELMLAPLDGEDVAELARAAAPLGEDAVRAVVGHAEGNALIAVETARALARGESGPAASLRGAVRAAFRGLEPGSRRVAELAAVAGRPLERGELADLGVHDAAGAAARALETGVLTSRSSAVGYRHALLRDAAYADIPEPQRAALHEDLARILSARGGSEGRRLAAEAARHFRLAGRDEMAAEQLAHAAAHAREVAALDQAASFLEEALAIVPGRVDMLLELAEVEAWRGHREASDAAFERALPELERAGGIELADAWLRRSRWYHGPICFPRGVADVAQRALVVLDRTGGDHTARRAEALAAIAWVEAVAGNVERAEELIAQVEELATRAPDEKLLAYNAGHARALALVRRGRFEDSYAPAAKAGEAAERAGRPDLAYGCWVNAAGAATASGDHERALAFIDRAEEGVRRRGLLGIEVQLLAGRASILTRMGSLADARSVADAEREVADRAGHPETIATAAHDRGMVALAEGDYATAALLLGAALAGGAAVSRPLARLARAEALARIGRCDEAEKELRATALEPVGPGDFPDTLVPRMNRVQGLIAAQRGDVALAERRLEEAADGWRRKVHDRNGDRLTSLLADFGRPVLGLVDPMRELDRVVADLEALPKAAV